METQTFEYLFIGSSNDNTNIFKHVEDLNRYNNYCRQSDASLDVTRSQQNLIIIKVLVLIINC